MNQLNNFEKYNYESVDAAVKYIYFGELENRLFTVDLLLFAYEYHIEALFQKILKHLEKKRQL